MEEDVTRLGIIKEESHRVCNDKLKRPRYYANPDMLLLQVQILFSCGSRAVWSPKPRIASRICLHDLNCCPATEQRLGTGCQDPPALASANASATLGLIR